MTVMFETFLEEDLLLDQSITCRDSDGNCYVDIQYPETFMGFC